MNLFKKKVNKELFKNNISMFMIFFLMNNLIAFGSENKSHLYLSEQRYVELQDMYKLNSTNYSEYDNLSSQLKIFFGTNSEKYKNNNYPDLSIIDFSDALREVYLIKLDDMTINKTKYKIKKEVLFKN